MRVFAILLFVLVLALAVILIAQLGVPSLSPVKPDRANGVRRASRTSTQGPDAGRNQTGTNSTAGSSEGFYVGKGGERVYVNYATPDPLLRSFLQSMMDGSSAPYSKGK